MIEQQKIIEVYVDLPEEGSPTIRPTKAILIERNVCKLLPTEDYDPEDEVWQFLPNTIVKIKSIKDDTGENLWLAYEAV